VRYPSLLLALLVTFAAACAPTKTPTPDAPDPCAADAGVIDDGDPTNGFVTCDGLPEIDGLDEEDAP
jgi:hypothetical protein